MRNKIIIFLALALAAGGGYYWYDKAADAKADAYKLAAIEKGDVAQTVTANGILNPVKLVSVGTQVSGTVRQLLADYNARVTKGQVLAVLDPELFDAQVAQSSANVKNAQAQLDLAIANEKRARELFAKDYISRQDMESNEQALKSARATLAQASAVLKKDMTNRGYSVIKSPVNGVIIDRQIDEGQTVAASFQTPTLFKIAQDLKKMQIDSSFSEADIAKIKVGQTAKFTVDAFMNKAFEGNVTQVRLNAVTVSNVVTYNVVVSVDNPAELLMPGMTAYVNIKTSERKNTLLIPNAALRYKPTNVQPGDKKDGGGDASGAQKGKKGGVGEGRGATVYVLENNAPKPLKITVGITDNKFTEVISGPLKEGDKVIMEETMKTSKKQSAPRMF